MERVGAWEFDWPLAIVGVMMDAAAVRRPI